MAARDPAQQKAPPRANRAGLRWSREWPGLAAQEGGEEGGYQDQDQGGAGVTIEGGYGGEGEAGEP